MDLQITFDESLPKEFHTLAERALRTAIDWLDAQPRPQETPAIENFIPDWGKMKFTLGDTAGRGMFSRDTMGGWCVVNVRLNGDCVLGLDKPIVIPNVDVELATTVGAIGMLDSYFYSGINSDRQLRRQLQFIDKLAATNGRAKSLNDQLDEAIKDKEEAERQAAYKAQFPLKTQQSKDNLRRQREIHTPAWYWAKYPDAIVSEHESKESAPPPRKAIYCSHTPPKPQPPAPPREPAPSPELDEFQKKAVAQQQAMQSYIEQVAAGYEQLNNACNPTTPEPSSGICEDEDM